MDNKNKMKRLRFQLKQRNYRNLPRLSVYITNKHIHAQVIDDSRSHTIFSMSSAQEAVKKIFTTGDAKGYNTSGALLMGGLIGEKAKTLGIKEVIFDRGSHAYIGKIRLIADEVRKHINIGQEKKST